MNNIIKATNTDLNSLYDGSAFTIPGAGGDLNEWFEGVNEMLNEKGIGKVEQMYTFSGKQVNDLYDLQGDNRFSNDITFLAFKLDGLDIPKLSMFKLVFEARWFDDIINNALPKTLID